MTVAEEACPKRMVHGPCGGVGPHGRCEVGGFDCPFVPRPVTATALEGRPWPLPVVNRPLVLADVPAPALDLDAFRRSAGTMAGWVDAGLTGDHGAGRVQLPPVLRAQALRDEGLHPWVGLNCRDRNRVALEGELAGLASVGVLAVHCVTGDHPSVGHRPDTAAVFDLDSTQLASLAAGAGLTASVAEAPLAPPVEHRPARLAAKARAGAAACIVNHSGSASVVAAFIAAARAAGAAQMAFLACVPLVVSRASITRLRSFTGLVAPPGLLERVWDAADPVAAGIAEAVRFAEEVLDRADVVGVDLSGVAGDGEELVVARSMAEVARRLR